jgi:hypothetical protein
MLRKLVSWNKLLKSLPVRDESLTFNEAILT